ncbi:MAG: hypothetical protein JW896_03520 [Deltaproteobacteria bacterium]|nr:hypothetical protein [Deltaproteobacteria bacterium]
MAKTLGIFISSDKHLDKIIEICKAAKNKETDVNIFFTHLGTLLTQDPRFKELKDLANMAICNVGFESHGLKQPVEGIRDKDYGTQGRHAELIDECDRYLVF